MPAEEKNILSGDDDDNSSPLNWSYLPELSSVLIKFSKVYNAKRLGHLSLPPIWPNTLNGVCYVPLALAWATTIITIRKKKSCYCPQKLFISCIWILTQQVSTPVSSLEKQFNILFEISSFSDFRLFDSSISFDTPERTDDLIIHSLNKSLP